MPSWLTTHAYLLFAATDIEPEIYFGKFVPNTGLPGSVADALLRDGEACRQLYHDRFAKDHVGPKASAIFDSASVLA